MRKKGLIIGIFLLVIIFVSIIIIYTNDNLRFKLSYEYINLVEYSNGKTIKVNIPIDNNIKYLENDEVISFFKTGTGIIYFGYDTCPWCRNMIEPLIEVVKEENIDTIYYVDSKKVKSIKDDLYKILDKYLRVDSETNEKRFAVPDVYFIKDGKIMSHHIGTVDSYKNPYKKMTISQKKELKKIYKEKIEAIK